MSFFVDWVYTTLAHFFLCQHIKLTMTVLKININNSLRLICSADFFSCSKKSPDVTNHIKNESVLIFPMSNHGVTIKSQHINKIRTLQLEMKVK